jgi:hypothetical protein
MRATSGLKFVTCARTPAKKALQIAIVRRGRPPTRLSTVLRQPSRSSRAISEACGSAVASGDDRGGGGHSPELAATRSRKGRDGTRDRAPETEKGMGGQNLWALTAAIRSGRSREHPRIEFWEDFITRGCREPEFRLRAAQFGLF